MAKNRRDRCRSPRANSLKLTFVYQYDILVSWQGTVSAGRSYDYHVLYSDLHRSQDHEEFLNAPQATVMQ